MRTFATPFLPHRVGIASTFAIGISKKYIGVGVDDSKHKGVGSVDGVMRTFVD